MFNVLEVHKSIPNSNSDKNLQTYQFLSFFFFLSGSRNCVVMDTCIGTFIVFKYMNEPNVCKLC